MARVIDLDDISISLVDQGSPNAEEVLLLVHGFPLDHSMWRGQLDDLATDFRCLAPDLRGFGASMVTPGTVTMARLADDLHLLLKRLPVSAAVTLCGLSMGGYVAWEMWQRHRECLRRLIICDSRAEADSTEVARGRHLMAQQVEQDGMHGVAETMIPKLFAADSRHQQPELVDSVRQVMDRLDPRGVAAAQRGMAERRDFFDRLAEIDLPTLVLCGQHDSITTSDEMRRLAEHLPHGQFVEIPSAGHLAPLEQPAAVNRAVRAFIQAT